MKRYFLIVSILFFTIQYITAQDYSVDLIPDSLKTNAYSVIRDYSRDYKLSTINSGLYKTRKVVTILDKNGDNHGSITISYDKNSSVNIKQIVIYDSEGKKIKNVKQSDILDYPEYSGADLYSESRIKRYEPVQAAYPYTIEYEYEVKLENIISYGAWRPLGSYNSSTQHASLTFSYPSDLKISRKEVFSSIKTSEKAGNLNIEKWEVNNLKAIEYEPFEVSLTERIPCVYLMPQQLKWDSYNGSAATWKEFGKWLFSLYAGRDELADADKQKVTALIGNIPDTLERIVTLYKYLQENTRYVNVTLGIGGFQPYDAKSVFENGYGDCKALTNYLYSLLKFCGIKSYPAIVASGEYKVPIFKDFPNFQQFDHVILSVPFKNDTIWLECTNQTIAFGFLGSFTDDRDVLLLTENGGKFSHTSKYSISDNYRSCKSEFLIDPTGSASCSMETIFKGLQYHDLSPVLNSNYDDQKKWLYNNSNLPSLQIKSFSIKNLKNLSPSAIIKESSVSKNFCSFSGKYMILSLNPVNVQEPLQKMLNKRYSDILINRSFTDHDTLVYIIPGTYKIESLPEGSIITTDFGSYSWSVQRTDNGIVYIRKMTIREGRYKPSDYSKIFDFIMSVSKADKTKILLTKSS